jgi:hypothetical protein
VKPCYWCGAATADSLCDEGKPSCAKCLAPVEDVTYYETRLTDVLLGVIRREPGIPLKDLVDAAVYWGFGATGEQSTSEIIHGTLAHMRQRGSIRVDRSWGMRTPRFYAVEGWSPIRGRGSKRKEAA